MLYKKKTKKKWKKCKGRLCRGGVNPAYMRSESNGASDTVAMKWTSSLSISWSKNKVGDNLLGLCRTKDYWNIQNPKKWAKLVESMDTETTEPPLNLCAGNRVGLLSRLWRRHRKRDFWNWLNHVVYTESSNLVETLGFQESFFAYLHIKKVFFNALMPDLRQLCSNRK